MNDSLAEHFASHLAAAAFYHCVMFLQKLTLLYFFSIPKLTQYSKNHDTQIPVG